MNRRIVYLLMMCGLLAILTACGGGGGGSSNGGGGGGIVTGPPMSITTTTLPDGFVGKTYSTQLAATGGIAPYTWSAISLPQGLTISGSGLISGTIQSDGGVLVGVQDSSSPRQGVNQQLNLNIWAELSIYTTSVPSGHTNIPYDFVIQSSDVQTWTITSGQLPAGLVMASPSRTQVEIKGTPTQKGSFTFTVQAQSVSNPPQTASKTYTFDIDDNPAILTGQLLDVVRNKAYQDTLSAVNGTPPYRWATQTALPAGILLDANTGNLSGTYSTFMGTFGSSTNVTFQVTDSGTPARSGTRVIPVNLLEQLTINSGFNQTATINQAFFGSSFAFGGRQPYVWSLGSGSLPTGLSLSPSGQIIGTPNQLGEYNFSLHLVDSTNPPQTADATYKITVIPPRLTTVYSLPGRVPLGAMFSGFVAAQGGTPPYTWQVNTGSLPTGLQLNASTGEVSGTPTTLGTYSFSVQVTDSGSPAQHTSAAYSMVVATPLGRNDSIQKATPIGNGSFNASLSPFSDPLDMANPDVDYYRIIVSASSPLQLNTYAKQNNSLNPLDTVLELVDANGARLNNCNPPTQPNGSYTSACLDDDIQEGVIQDSRLYYLPPSTVGTQFTIYARVSDWRGDARPDMTYSIAVTGAVDPLTLSRQYVPDFLYSGSSFNLALIASGGVKPYTYAVGAGSLPPGLMLSQDGNISGAPTTAGTYSFTFTVTDHQSVPQTASIQYSIKIADAVTITTPAAMTDACLGKPYTFIMQGSGGFPPLRWFLNYGDSITPAGISFNSLEGQWTGTPTVTGTFTGSVTLYDAYQRGYTQGVTLTIKNCQ